MKASLGALLNGSSLLRLSLEHGWGAAAKVCCAQQTRVATTLSAAALKDVTLKVSRYQQHHATSQPICLYQHFGQLLSKAVAGTHVPLLPPSTWAFPKYQAPVLQLFSADKHTRRCTSPTDVQHAPSVAPRGARLCHQHYSKPGSRQKDTLAEAAAWVAQVLSSGNLKEASRRVVMQLLNSLTKMLHILKSAEERLQLDFRAGQRGEKTVAIHAQLPAAIVALIERTVYLATSENVPLGGRVHPPVALLQISSALHAAPDILQRKVMPDGSSSRVDQALRSVLKRCIDRREFHRESRFVSMTCKSLVLLHEAGICTDTVRVLQAKYLGYMRTNCVKVLDIQSVLDLCALMATFRAAPDQRRPRAWYTCLARLEELVAQEALTLPHAGKFARSAGKMQGKLQPWLQNSIIEAGVQFAKPQSAQKKQAQARDVVQYLAGTAEMKLPIPKGVVQELFHWTIGRRGECSPQMIVDMLVALQRMQLHSRHQKHWRKVRMFARRASVDDLQKFCIAAQVHKVFLDASVVEEIATAAGTVTSEKSKAASKTALILQTLHRLDSILKQIPGLGICKNQTCVAPRCQSHLLRGDVSSMNT